MRFVSSQIYHSKIEFHATKFVNGVKSFMKNKMSQIFLEFRIKQDCLSYMEFQKTRVFRKIEEVLDQLFVSSYIRVVIKNYIKWFRDIVLSLFKRVVSCVSVSERLSKGYQSFNQIYLCHIKKEFQLMRVYHEITEIHKFIVESETFRVSDGSIYIKLNQSFYWRVVVSRTKRD